MQDNTLNSIIPIFMKFIHAGAAIFDKDRFCEVQDLTHRRRYLHGGVCLKPAGGLWGTPLGNPEWSLFGICEDRFEFGLKPTARLLEVYQSDQLIKALRRKPSWDHRDHWVWLTTRFDAIWVHKIDAMTAMTGWDIESIVVLNSNVIEV
jgi:hypothetical protein